MVEKKEGEEEADAAVGEKTRRSSPLPAAHLANVRESSASLHAKLRTVPGAEAEATAPPPLVLCEASAYLGRPSLVTLLGIDGGIGGGDVAELVPAAEDQSEATKSAAATASAEKAAPANRVVEITGAAVSEGVLPPDDVPLAEPETELVGLGRPRHRRHRRRRGGRALLLGGLVPSVQDRDAARARCVPHDPLARP